MTKLLRSISVVAGASGFACQCFPSQWLAGKAKPIALMYFVLLSSGFTSSRNTNYHPSADVFKAVLELLGKFLLY
ncbi:hypothetical protein ACTMU2_39230 [Cupriavidus basilensis]